GLPRRAPEPARQQPRSLSRRDTRLRQLSGRVDPLGTLAAGSASPHRHDITVLPEMSLIARDAPGPFQPPVAQRDLEAEIIAWVGGVMAPPWAASPAGWAATHPAPRAG